MAKKRKAGMCLSCYKRNGRLDPVHRDDGSTLLPLPRGEFAVIDTEDFDRVKGYSWHRTGNGYVAAIMPDRKKKTHFLLHRVIVNAAPDDIVDHRDHDPLNNRKGNLPIGSQSENMHNMRPRKGQRYRGVRWRKDTGKWEAKIRCNGVIYSLGAYESAEEAAFAYNRAAVELFKHRAVLNDLGKS